MEKVEKYNQLSAELQERMLADRAEHKENPYRADDADAVRRKQDWDKNNLLRPSYCRDIDKILHLPFYNRYSDKTQVFSFYLNDDITRRGLHVQLVSRIARNIGRLLGLNLDLIEAIALGHDIGHTPFGHTGERYLDELSREHGGSFFAHNVNSVRVLDKLFCRNVSLQTLDGVLCHNGEFELKEYRPVKGLDFTKFDEYITRCDQEGEPMIKTLIPSTLEGCVVRISDMIAYVGKDRQDALTARIIDADTHFSSELIGTNNARMINNLVVDIVENSYGKDFIQLSAEAYSDLKIAKKENFKLIYLNEKVQSVFESTVKPMFAQLFERLLKDVKEGNRSDPIFSHHIELLTKMRTFYDTEQYGSEPDWQIVVDYIAGMTDDYFVELHRHLFPNSKYRIEYKSYFE